MEIIWLPFAQEDLDNIYQYYLVESQTVAFNVYNQILDDVDRLAEFPQMASVESLLERRGKEYRSLVIFKGLYKVIYYIEDKIYITAVWCCRQNPDNMPKR